MIRDLTLEQKIEVAAEQIENSLDICFTDEKKQIRLILAQFAQELVSGDNTGEKQCNLPVVTNRVFAVKNTCGDWVSLHNNKEDAEKVASSKNTRLGEMLGFYVDEEEVL